MSSGTDYAFCAMVFETLGAINTEGQEVLCQIFRYAAKNLGKEFTSYCSRAWARVSCCLQRSVGQSILNRIDGFESIRRPQEVRVEELAAVFPVFAPVVSEHVSPKRIVVAPEIPRFFKDPSRALEVVAPVSFVSPVKLLAPPEVPPFFPRDRSPAPLLSATPGKHLASPFAKEFVPGLLLASSVVSPPAPSRQCFPFARTSPIPIMPPVVCCSKEYNPSTVRDPQVPSPHFQRKAGCGPVPGEIWCMCGDTSCNGLMEVPASFSCCQWTSELSLFL